MKLLGVLVSFALVGNILVTKLDDYIKLVLLINDDIRQAREFMPQIIKNIVSNVYGMEEIAFMLAVPDNINDELLVPESDSDSDDEFQIPFENLVLREDLNQDQIPLINLDPEEGPSQRQIPELNLDPSPVPEEVLISQNSNFVDLSTIQLDEKLQFQQMMKLEMLAVTDRPEYENIIESARNAQTGPTPVPIQSLDLNRQPNYAAKENVASVLEERRIHPSKVPRNRVIRAFGLDSLARTRREMTLEAITELIRQKDPLFQDLYLMCRLVGAFRSIKYPLSYTSSASLDDDEEHCVIFDTTFIKSYVYKFIDDELWEVDKSSVTHEAIKPFLSELE